MQPEHVVIADLIRERDEAREQVRSLTVERDAARADVESQREMKLEAAEECDALRARLSRAREALDAYDEDPPVFWGQSAEDPALVAWVERQEKALAALRAALSEPPAG